MTATPADIAAGTREATVATWQSAPIKARYPGARDAGSPPSEGFFELAADALAAANQRGALLGVERRRFSVPVADLIWIDPSSGLPTYQLVDSELAANTACIPARLELDLENETTTLELFG